MAENGGFLGSDVVGEHIEEIALEIRSCKVPRATYRLWDEHLYTGDTGYILKRGFPVGKTPTRFRLLVILEHGAPTS